MKYKIFIDGHYGTTGLKIDDMLRDRDDLEILQIPKKDKKSIEIKKKFLNEADLVFLCLPDSVSEESVKLITNKDTKVIDASTVHRTDENWVYGIPELKKDQRKKIKNSKRVCVPGCHATGFIMALKPLLENNIISKSQKLICNSITGYSGGGRELIGKYEDPNNRYKFQSQRLYALGLDHKHLPEMQYILGLDNAPFFTPSVGNFSQGMLVMSYLIKDEFVQKISKNEIIEIYKEYYKDEKFVDIIDYKMEHYLDEGFLSAVKCNNSNKIEISVYDNNNYMLIAARLDNLGKGASGAAVQNMNIMLGLDEESGLVT